MIAAKSGRFDSTDTYEYLLQNKWMYYIDTAQCAVG